MATVQDVYEGSLELIDEIQDSGAFVPEDDEEKYKARTKRIIQRLLPELLPKGIVPNEISTMDDVLQIENSKAISALEYGVAAFLIIDDENPSKSAFYNDKYEELKKESKQGSTKAKITDVHNVLGGMN